MQNLCCVRLMWNSWRACSSVFQQLRAACLGVTAHEARTWPHDVHVRIKRAEQLAGGRPRECEEDGGLVHSSAGSRRAERDAKGGGEHGEE